MTAKIQVMANGKVVYEYLLDKEDTIIGRRKESDIAIRDSAVSGTHACIHKIGGLYQIQDLKSTNGLHIRGRRIQQQVLKDEDIVILGEHQLKFVEVVDAAVPAASASYPVVEESVSEVTGPRRSDKPAAPQSAYLFIQNGVKKHEKIELDETLKTVGTPGIQVAAISLRPSGHFIVHVDGGEDRTRVPVVNGDPIGFKSRKLEYGDVIEVAGIQMQYLVSDETVIKLR